MVILFYLTLILILIYLLYPVFLRFLPRFHPAVSPPDGERKDGVTLILLTCNGYPYFEDKIKEIHAGMQCFREQEIIVIDDGSHDGTRELAENLKEKYGFLLIAKEHQQGIPHSMNLGVSLARYETIIFSDQRQKLAGCSLEALVKPLQDDRVGAVSACISSLNTTNNHFSLLRAYENFLKKMESRSGELIGVYGPLYAIRKTAYCPISQHIILDDLYLSMRILASKKIILCPDVMIIDDDFSGIYDYSRSRRYLHGFLQIILKKELMKGVPFHLRIMLLWHKYLRLLIPPLLIICYLTSFFFVPFHPTFAIIFILISLIVILSALLRKEMILANIHTFCKINLYYVVSMINILFTRLIRKSFRKARPKPL
ncbi:MAG: glycosyltransferase [Bacteroidetes bacterium]|nr:glycosyltransferase [Bacteroidota bacterium]